MILDRRWKQTRPQLFGPSQAAAQARRAAGVTVPDYHNSIFTESWKPRTNWGSARRFVRRMYSLAGVKSRFLSQASQHYAQRRRKALGPDRREARR